MKRAHIARVLLVFFIVLPMVVLLPAGCSQNGHGDLTEVRLVIDVVEDIDEEKKPLPNARVTLNGGQPQTTDANGVVAFRVMPGEYEVVVQKSLYNPVQSFITVGEMQSEEIYRHTLTMERNIEEVPEQTIEKVQAINNDIGISIFTFHVETTPHVFQVKANGRLMHYEGDGEFSLATSSLTPGDVVHIISYDRYGERLNTQTITLTE